jgi:outer membrane PBP1 activator LpoA protein
MTYFDRQEAEQKAKRAAVMSAGLWADEDATGRRIGVILPLQGASRRAGDSVLAGMMAGYWADDPEQRARLTFYTEEQYGSLARAYATALDNGAEVIVGPLQKDAVQRMVETTIIAKPTIALNTTKSPGWQERNLYQFSLAIEEEAINAARCGPSPRRCCARTDGSPIRSCSAPTRCLTMSRPNRSPMRPTA